MFELVDKKTGEVVAQGKCVNGPEVDREVCKMIARGDISARAIENAVKSGTPEKEKSSNAGKDAAGK